MTRNNYAIERNGEMDPQSDRDEISSDNHVADGDNTQEREMPCPVCGAPMPDLKGGKASICPVCGFKDSCCY